MSLFLSKKEIYKERKFSFFIAKISDFGDKDTKIAQIFDSFSLLSRKSVIFTKRDEVSRRNLEDFGKIEEIGTISSQFEENVSFSKAFNKFIEFVEKSLISRRNL